MKKIRFAAMMAAAALLLFASCGKDDDTNSNSNNPSGGNGNNTETIKWVDLELPSGLMWATCNVGASSPEEYGDYFAWGEISTKSVYDWSTYRYCTVDEAGALSTLTKYNTESRYGTIDNHSTLLAIDDAARAAFGKGARTPTKEDWEELMSNTNSEWATQNGVNGWKLTAANGNSIFLPAAGNFTDETVNKAGIIGNYWSATLYEGYPNGAWVYGFYSEKHVLGSNYRCVGYSVRAVRATL